MSWLLAAWIGCQALDLSTTVIGLQRGYVEANPVLRGRVVALKVGVNVGMWIWREKSSQRAATVGIPLGMAVAGCVPGAINLRTLQRR